MNFDRFDTLSFDCYGTLIDWEAGIYRAIEPILSRHGVTCERETLLERYGRAEAEAEHGSYLPYRDILRASLARLGEALGFQPSTEELDAFGASVADWPAFPDSSPALAALGERYRLVILSNIDDDLFAHSQRRLGVPFHRVYTAQQIGSYKPNPANFEYLIARVDGAPERLLHVAQSLFHDIAPASACGLSTVWVNRRHDKPGSGATPASAARADLEVPDMASLAARLIAA